MKKNTSELPRTALLTQFRQFQGLNVANHFFLNSQREIDARPALRTCNLDRLRCHTLSLPCFQAVILAIRYRHAYHKTRQYRGNLTRRAW